MELEKLNVESFQVRAITSIEEPLIFSEDSDAVPVVISDPHVVIFEKIFHDHTISKSVYLTKPYFRQKPRIK